MSARRLRMLAAALALAGSVTLAALPAAGSGGNGPGAVGWPTYGFDLQRTGYNPTETVLGSANAGSLRLRWTAALGDVMIAQAVEAESVYIPGRGTKNVVYEGTEHGDFYALDAATGQVLWQKNLGSEQTSCEDMPDGVFGVGGAAVVDRTTAAGVVYVAGGDGAVHALSLASGQEQPGWPVRNVFDPRQEHVYGGLNERAGKLYVTVASHCDFVPYHGRVSEIDIATRTVQASFYPATPDVDGGGVWGPGGASIDPATGHVFAATGNALTDPEYYFHSNSVVELDASLNLVGANYPGLTGVDVDFGATPILYRPAGCPTTQVAAKNKSGVLVVYDEGALDAGYTQRLQMADVNDYQFNGIPAWDPVTNMLYVSNSSDSSAGTYFHGLVALHAGADCQLSLAWQQTVGPNSTSVSPPTVANGVVYYGDGFGNTERAFDAATGAQLWSSGSTIGGGVYAAPTVVDGMLLVPAWDGKLYAFAPSGAGSPPTVSSFSPASGPVGTAVDIRGTGFTGATRVTFNGVADPGFVVNSATDISAHVPAGATTGRIAVTTPSGTGTSASSFTVTGGGGGAPTITSFSPVSGHAGTRVTITGTNFTGATSVKLGATPAPFAVNSSTVIVATAPSARTGAYRWSVTTPSGTAVSSRFFYLF